MRSVTTAKRQLARLRCLGSFKRGATRLAFSGAQVAFKRELGRFRSLGGTADPSCRMDQVYEREAATGRYLSAGLGGRSPDEPISDRAKDVASPCREAPPSRRRFDPAAHDARDRCARFVLIAIGGEGIEQLHLGAGGLNRDYVGVERTDGVDYVVQLRVAQ